MKKSEKINVNKARENIIWRGWQKKTESDTLNVELAGVTFPDENYAIKRGRATKRVFDNMFVIEYVTSGVGYLESQGIRVRVGEGDLYVIHRRTVHSYYADKQQPFSKKWINVSGKFINALSEVFFTDGPFTVVHLGQDAEKIMDDIHGILKNSVEATDVDERIMHRLLDLCLLIDAHNKNTSRELSTFERIAEYIEQNLLSEVSVSSVCERFFISPSTLYRLFKKNTGASPKEYIQSKKLDAAKRMIEANDSPLNVIAATLGFYDSHHFFRVFREATGMSPSEYRKKILKGEDNMQ